MPCLDYGEKELAYLSKKDKKLAVLIERFGYLQCELRDDVFASLIRSIAIQQISNKAAETICRRMAERFPSMTPSAFAAVPVEEIQKIGISMKKASYIKGVVDAAMRGDIDFASLSGAGDAEIFRDLTGLKGVGAWTVEMLLIFSLGRKNVLSWGDYAIRKSICMLYGHKELNQTRFEKYRKRYSPYCSVASLYLWHQLH